MSERVNTEIKTPFQLIFGCADGLGDAISDDLVGKGPELMEKMIGGREKMRKLWRAETSFYRLTTSWC